jgi:hypothetical protein
VIAVEMHNAPANADPIDRIIIDRMLVAEAALRSFEACANCGKPWIKTGDAHKDAIGWVAQQMIGDPIPVCVLCEQCSDTQVVSRETLPAVLTAIRNRQSKNA